MRPYRTLIVSAVLIIVMWSCDKLDCKKDFKLDGVISEQGITTYQYGTHVIVDTGEPYALRSDKVDLNDHVGQSVRLWGEKIDGYPVDGGPVYVDVYKVE